MKAIISAHSWASSLVTTFWTPFFVCVFIAIVVYALWPRNDEKFNAAANIPLRDD